jgi:hypothetical protein
MILSLSLSLRAAAVIRTETIRVVIRTKCTCSILAMAFDTVFHMVLGCPRGAQVTREWCTSALNSWITAVCAMIHIIAAGGARICAGKHVGCP